jgi:P pilus assembly chaperone PapD
MTGVLALVLWTASACAPDGGGSLDPSDGVGSSYSWGRLKKGDTTLTVVRAPSTDSIVVSPTSAVLAPRTQQMFIAKAWLDDTTTVRLTVNWTALGGSIDSSGLYTAPITGGQYRVVGRAASGMVDTTTVTVGAAAPDTAVQSLVLTPASVALAAGASQAFTVAGMLGDGSLAPVSATYTATGGTITPEGLYTAGRSGGTFRVIATADGLADTSVVTVSASPTVQQIVLTPSTVSLQPGGTQQFSAAAKLSDGTTTSAAVTYSATGGSIGSTGLYTAGSTAGTFRVVATASNGIADTAAVSIQSATSDFTQIVLTPALVTLQPGATQQFVASGRRADGTTGTVAVTFVAGGGTVTSGGLYTAGQTTGTYRVIATQQNGTLTDTSSVTIAATASSQTGEQAIMADLVPDALGVNVHLFYSGTVYVNRYSDVIRPRLAELGVRHLRDHAVNPTSGNAPTYRAKLQELAANGTKALLIFDERYCTPAECEAFVKGTGAATVDAVEGWNEPDRRLSRTDLSWLPRMKTYMQDTWKAVKGDPTTAGILVGSPSIEFGTTASALGDVSGIVEFGSIHPYPPWPNYPTYQDRVAAYVDGMTPAYPGTPWWTTEAGYHTSQSCADRPVSETAQGRYLPRMLLEYMKRGQVRVYNYELIDEGTPDCDREHSFGILRLDGSPKPAFTALKNLLTLLDDPGASFTPGRLDYTVSGPASLHRRLLQKRDGTFWLALWLEVASYDTPTTATATLTLGNSHAITRYATASAATGTTMGNGTSFNVPVNDAVTLLEIQ